VPGARSRITAFGAPLAAILSVTAVLSLTAALSVTAIAADPTAVAPALLTPSDIAGRLRVFALPGDYKLENALVTAVVRKRDGFLTEFWPVRPRLPTSDQLGTESDIDGIWQIQPIVYTLSDNKPQPITIGRVATRADAIETEGVIDVAGVRYRALTHFRLDPRRAVLRITTSFSVDGGGPGGPIGLGDLVKWGNVPYVVEGISPPRMTYRGPARWIGRRGAAGDLLLRRSDGERLFLDYSARFRGFQGAIHALYHRGPIPTGKPVSVTRELAYEPLPTPRPAETGTTANLTLKVRDEAGAPLAAKLRIDRDGSTDPLFEDDGGLDGADRFAWTGNGELERELVPGRYKLLVTSGIERNAKSFTVNLRAGQRQALEARLTRAIATPGWISGDLHLHQAPSVDADISLPIRVISVAAEGVELAVATDHYVVTDLAPTVAFLRARGALSSKLLTVPGTEVSTVGRRFGHFNVFPLTPERNVVFDNTTPSELFADARRKSPGGVLQVNHPRWDEKLGYFTYVALDENTGEPRRPGWDPNFDLLEVYNGDDAKELKDVKKVFLDWIHLLGRGHRYVATGSSDSHNLAFLDPGLPRTMIRHGIGTSDATDVDVSPASVLHALKAGRVTVTSGPILEATVNGRGPGETATGVGKRARLEVRVQAAPWVDVASLSVLLGGQGRLLHWVPVPRTGQPQRLRRIFDIPVESKTFVIVAAEGERPLPNASRDGTLPFAFTNPIWLEP
jgi:hypothetical protein